MRPREREEEETPGGEGYVSNRHSDGTRKAFKKS
jgi:hypothetical protein